MSAKLFHRVSSWRRAAEALGLATVVLVVGRLLLPPNALISFVAIGAAVAGLTCLIVHEVLRQRLTRRAMERIAVAAAEERRKRLVRDYQRYLVDAA